MTHTQVAFPLARGVHSRAPTDTEGILLRIGAKALKENVVAVDAAKPFALWAIEAFKLLDRLDNLAHREEALLRLVGAPRSATVRPSRVFQIDSRGSSLPMKPG